MSDLISRQAAIAAIDECYCGGEDSCGEPWIYKENAVEAINMIEPLSSAEPKRGTWNRLGMENLLGTNLASLGTDCISRQAAMDALTEYGNGRAVFISVGEAVIRIEQLPSAEPAEPKTGRWILDRSGAYCCSKCMEPCAGYVMMKPRDKFCKMCGAKMEVTE